MFTKNALGEYWQAYCLVCTNDVFSSKVDDVHFVFEDEQLIGRPICKGCYEELKDKIPNNIDLIKKQEIERAIVRKNFTVKNIFAGIEKTHEKKIKNNLEKWL